IGRSFARGTSVSCEALGALEHETTWQSWHAASQRHLTRRNRHAEFNICSPTALLVYRGSSSLSQPVSKDAGKASNLWHRSTLSKDWRSHSNRRARQQDGADRLGATCKARKPQSSGRGQGVSLTSLDGQTIGGPLKASGRLCLRKALTMTMGNPLRRP